MDDQANKAQDQPVVSNQTQDLQAVIRVLTTIVEKVSDLTTHVAELTKTATETMIKLADSVQKRAISPGLVFTCMLLVGIAGIGSVVGLQYYFPETTQQQVKVIHVPSSTVKIAKDKDPEVERADKLTPSKAPKVLRQDEVLYNMLANQKRFVRDPLLDEVTRRHLSNVVKNSSINHVGPDGKGTEQRLRDANVKFTKAFEIVPVKFKTAKGVYDALENKDYIALMNRYTKIGIANSGVNWVIVLTD